MGAIWQGLRYALRGITRAPFLSFVVLLALSAGIGLNAAVFALVETGWFRGPVEKDPDSFIQVIPSYTGWFSTEKFFTFTRTDYEAFRARARSLQQVAGYTRMLRRTLDDDLPRFGVGLVTCNFFDVYGWGPPVKGRLFLPKECATPGVSVRRYDQRRAVARPLQRRSSHHRTGHPYRSPPVYGCGRSCCPRTNMDEGGRLGSRYRAALILGRL